MVLHTGLYYPYVHFRDESWAKAAALYWRKLARVVPAGFPVRDRPAVQELNEDSRFLISTDPRPAAEAVAPAFIAAVQDNAEVLRARYAVEERPFGRPWQSPPSLALSAERLTGLYPPEVDHELVAALEEAGLARWEARVSRARERVPRVGAEETSWVVVDPALAWVYKCALTQELARRTAFVPVTDQLDAYAVTGDWTPGHIADTLLGRTAPSIGRESARAAVAMMSVRCVLPADLRNVPAEKIVRLRKDYAGEFAAFTAAVEAATGEVVEATRQVTDRAAFESHLQDAFDVHVAQPLESLRKAINGLKMDTVYSALTIKPEATLPGAGLGLWLGGTTTAVGAGIAFTALAARQAAAQQRDNLVAASPAGYLLRVEKELKPATVLRRAGQVVARAAGVGL
ncbi:DUF6236 family protein [Streptomyces sp. NRRL S-87]|uniref:DUF6236 family protein n=1 Tax=Streptomyces sp. NRRL S-87 TaxID=1463920 RepID=UPI00131DBDFB|nr:DUF6236 family protein [Streptomyces sp. NRRL S-87]